MDTIQDILKQQWGGLPAPLREKLSSDEIWSALAAVVEKHGLRIDQAGVLENETVLVLVGLEPPDEYVLNLKRNLSLPDTEVEALARDVDASVFAPIRQAFLQEGQQDTIPSAPDTEKPDSEERPSRDELMREIEDDEPDALAPQEEKSKTSEPSLEPAPSKEPTDPETISDVPIEKKTRPSSGAPSTPLSTEEEKLLRPTVTKQQSAPPETLPKKAGGEETKTRPYGGVDPYREPAV